MHLSPATDFYFLFIGVHKLRFVDMNHGPNVHANRII